MTGERSYYSKAPFVLNQFLIISTPLAAVASLAAISSHTG